MAKQSSLFKTIATILATSAVTLSVAVGAVVGRALNKQNQNSQIPGQNGQGETLKSIDRVEKTNTYGLIDEYTIFYTDGTTSIFIVTNGSDGQPGAQGFPGRDGVTPTITIENGKWVINGQVTELDAVGPQGPQGPQGPAGQNGLTPYIGPNGHWWIGETDTGVQARGMDGEDGYIPLIGENGNWWIGGTDTGVPAQGQSGRGISSIEKTDSQGLIDVYTIYYTDGTTSTFLVTNGADGSAQGQGIPGPAGHTPVITVGENGNWFVDGVDTGTHAQGPQGQNGQDGYNVLTGEGVPAADLGKNGDSYIDLLNWDYYVMDNGAWTKVGNIAGANGVSGSSVSAGNGDPTTNNIPGNPGDTYIDLSTGDFYHMGDNGEWGNPDANSNFALPHVGANGNWWVGDEDTGVAAQGPAGQDGSSIHTGSGNPSGDPDNGVPAVPGNAGDTYIDLSTGDVYHMGDNGEWGSPDSSSSFAIPHIGENGHWYVGETDTGINATGPQGPQGPAGASVSVNHGDPTTNSVEGKQGDTYIDLDTGYYYTYDETNGWVKSGEGAAATSVLTGSGEPAATTGKDGDSYINLANWDFYVKEAGEWNLAGNIKGADGAAGAQGSSVNVGHGDPTTGNVPGNAGDTYIDLDTGNYYTMTNEGWGEPAGGGAIGTSIRYGNTAPENSLGNNGDSYINTATWDYYAKENGVWVLQGNFAGQNGTNGVSISSVEKTGTSGLVDTYTITYSDNTSENPHVDTFTVTNGADGNKIIVGTGAPTSETTANEGDNYIDVETWKLYVKDADDWTDKGSFKGDAGQDGVSIVSVTLKESNDLIDTYEITYSDSTATDPHVDNFYVTNGKDGTSVRTGHRDPRAVADDPVTPENEAIEAESGIEGDSFIDLDSWNYYVLQDDGEGNLVWKPEGNLHYSPNRYTVTFDSNGGTDVDSYDEALEGFTIPAPANAPTQDGYFFQGWYTAEGTRWDFSKDVITQDTTLTARWGQFIVEDGIITDCSITSGDIVIPEFYDNQLVTGIGDGVFEDRTEITSITLSHTIKTIGERAFYNCDGLTSFVIPNNVKSIGDYAFAECDYIEYFFIEEAKTSSVTSSLRALPSPFGLESIGEYAFSGCYALKGIVLPSTVTSIGKGAFSDCYELSSYSAPFIGGSEPKPDRQIIFTCGYSDPTTEYPASEYGYTYFNVSNGDFWYRLSDEWEYLDTFDLDGVVIGTVSPFNDPEEGQLSYITVDVGAIYINDNGKWKLVGTMNELPEVKSVFNEEKSFLGYVFGADEYGDNDSYVPDALETIVITGNSAIKEYAMYDCDYVKNIIITGEPSSISGAAFADCDGLKTLTLPYIGGDSECHTYSYSYGNGHPDSVDPVTGLYFDLDTNILYQLFDYGWSDITENTSDLILIRDGGVIITDTEPDPSSGNAYFNYVTGNLYSNYTGSSWALYKNITEYAFLDYTTNYLGYLFGATSYTEQSSFVPSSLEKVILLGLNGENKDTVTPYAFYGCGDIEIVLPENTRIISEYAFARAEFTSFVIPNSVIEIGIGAFEDADELEEMTIPFVGKNANETVSAYSVFSYIFNGDTPNSLKKVTLTGGNGANRDTIPFLAFESSNLREVILPEGITTIGAGAFHFCTDLESINFPSTLKTIEDSAFFQTKLNSIVLPEGLETIGQQAFASTRLSYILVPGTVTTIGSFAFASNGHLKSIVFQNGYDKTFGDKLFSDCPALESVYLGYGITSVKEAMFDGVKSLKNVSLAESITSIGGRAFAGCTSLKAIYLPANLESIGIQAFYRCTGLETLNMPNRVSSLGRMAFEGCTSLKYLTLSENLTSLDIQMFQDCTSLEAIAMPSSLKVVGTRAFFGCTSLKYIVLNDGLENINEFAFTGCDSLESIIIPDSVRNIDRGAFSTGLTRHGNLNDVYSKRDYISDVLYGPYSNANSVSSNTGDIYVCTDSGNEGKVYVKDDDNKWQLKDTLPYELLFGETNPTTIESGKAYINVKTGDMFVEFRCNLKSITLPFVGGSADFIGEHIYSGALADGEKPAADLGDDNDLYIDTASSSIYRKVNGAWMSQVVMTNDDNSIGTMDAGTNTPDPDDAASCDYYINTDTGEYWYKTADDKWGDSVGHIQNMFNSFGYFFVAAGSRQKSGFLNGLVPETLKIVVLTNTAEIGDGAFAKCSHIETVILPNTLTSIGNTSFEGCTSLKSINVPNSVLTIGNYAFANCTKLNAVNLGNNVKSIGDYAFMNVGLGWERSEVRYGHGDPINTPASMNGDFYVDVNTGELYIRQNDVWRKGKITVTFTDKYSYEFEYEPASQGDFWGWQNWYDDEKYDMYVRIGTRWEEANMTCYIGHGAPTITCGDRNGYWYVDLDTEDLYVSCNGVWEKGRITPIAVSNCRAYEYYQTHDYNPNCEYHIDTTFSVSAGWDYNDGDTSLTFIAESGDGMGSGAWYLRVLPGHGAPVAQEGEKYVDVDSGKIYILQSNNWVLTGNTTVSHGAPSTVGADGYYFDLDSGLLCHKGEDGFSSIVIPNSVRHIGFGAFEGCDSLETMAVPFVGGSYGVTYNYGHGAPTNSEESEVYFDIDGRTVWCKTNGQWEEVDLFMYGIDISAATIGESAPSGTANDDDYHIDYTTGACYRYSGYSNEWLQDGALTMLQEFNSSYFAYIFGAEIYVNQNPYDSKVPDSLKTVVLNSGTKFIAPAMAQDVIHFAAFAYCDHIENIILPNDIIEIFPGAFYHCEALKQISLPNNLEYVGSEAFAGCIALESIAFPDKVNSIDGYAFQDCSSLTYAVFSPNSNLDYMGSNTFSNCVSLKSFVAPNGTKTILNLAFENCSSLESLIIPNTVEELGNYILQGCSSLKYLSVPFLSGDYNPGYRTDGSNKVTANFDPTDSDNYTYWFNSVTGDVFFKMADGWHLMYHPEVFAGFADGYDYNWQLPENPAIGTIYLEGKHSYSFMQIYTAEGWTDRIDLDYHFLGSFFGGVDNSAVPATLKNVAITGDNSNIINVYAFAGCTNLETVTLPDSYEKIDDGMFSGCTSLKSFAFGENIKTIGDYAFANAGLTSIIIPDSVTKIGAYAFAGYSFESFVIPDTVTSIGLGVIQGWNNLATLSVSFVGQTSDTNNYLGHLFGATSYSGNSSSVPASLKTVIVRGNDAIGQSAFSGCSNLEDVLIIGDPSSIGSYALSGCSSLRSLTIPYLGNAAINTNSRQSLSHIFGNSYGYSNAAYVPNSLTKVVVLGGNGENRDIIPTSAFNDCSHIETIIISNNIKEIQSSALAGSGITSFIIPDTVTTLGDGVFVSCNSLKSLVIPDSVTTIGRYLADINESLETIVVGNGVSTIKENICYNCPNLRTVVLGKGVRTIEYGAFQMCPSLTSVIMQEGVTSIGERAFYNCTSLTTIILPTTIETLDVNL